MEKICQELHYYAEKAIESIASSSEYNALENFCSTHPSLKVNKMKVIEPNHYISRYFFFSVLYTSIKQKTLSTPFMKKIDHVYNFLIM